MQQFPHTRRDKEPASTQPHVDGDRGLGVTGFDYIEASGKGRKQRSASIHAVKNNGRFGTRRRVTAPGTARRHRRRFHVLKDAKRFGAKTQPFVLSLLSSNTYGLYCSFALKC